MAVLLGTTDADRIGGTETGDIVTAFDGDDVILGMAGGDAIDAGDGDDTVYANHRGRWADEAVDTVLGGAGDDHVFGGYGDVLNGGTGFDLLSLDLSSADRGVQANFRPLTLASVPEVAVVRIGTTQLAGFQSVADVLGSAFADRITLDYRQPTGVRVEGAGGDDFVRATVLDDVLRGGDGRDRLAGSFGSDLLEGGDGDDALSGGRGKDLLIGGEGADRFVFLERDTARSATNADVIADFDRTEGDRVDLRRIDAVAGGDDDRFVFVGSREFSGTAGELRSEVVDGATFVHGDTNGDARADFVIRLDGALEMVRSDFHL